MNEPQQTGARDLERAPQYPPDTKFVLMLQDIEPPAGSRPADGAYYVRSFDPDADNGAGRLEVTGSLARAKVYETPVEAFNEWKLTAMTRYQCQIMTADGQGVICRRCVEYHASGGKKEAFEYLPPDGFEESGAVIYIDVARAMKLVELSGRLPCWEDNPENLWPHVFAHEIYEPHLPHVTASRSKPGLMLKMLLTRLSDGRLEELHVFADGNHRMAADLCAGQPFFFYVLDADESRRVSSTNLFDICGEMLVADLLGVCQKLNEQPWQFFDRYAEAYRLKLAALECGTEPGLTMTEVNRVRALRDAAYVLTRRTMGATFRPCPVHGAGLDCSLCRA